MASTAYRQRSSSPFRSFHKPASVDGHIPGYSHHYSASSTPTAHHYSSPSPTNYQQHHSRGRSLTPTRARSMTPPTFKFKFGSPSSARSNSYHGIPPLSYSPSMDYNHQPTGGDIKENVLVTVRFRPLSLREIHRGDEVAWYADGETIVRSEYNPATAYAFDRVFGPATTTKAVYDSAAKQVVRGAMEGVNGTVFAYGVTSSGKTHTMHGDQKSPGIIPLAVKDVFSIIQDTPGREYLLRVSYLEIYNEVINDLLDPAGQNLRIREDSQGTYVEGVKEEVVLSPAHALSLIAAGEEHRHVGSNNFNLLSSRSHTIFSLTIESSSRTGDCYDDDVTLSQLNLIDLAGSESSKTETTGLRRKEGSYINKSLLTLGTVIGKLSGDSKASHVPFRDSKLTRLLQSSLSGHGRVSLICTLTPATSSIEETHNTLKFAQRAKRVAVYAAPNRIMDEKSLIKKYQKEISSLKHELEQLKRGIFDKSYLYGATPEDLLTLRQQLEAGQVKLQSRLEEEEQAKAALLGRIQRLTKLILVSTKSSTLSNEPEHRNHRRHHSFSEDDLKYLAEKAGAFGLDFDDVGNDLESSAEGKLDGDDAAKEDRKNKRRSMLGWFKLKRNGTFNSTMSMDSDLSPNGSPGSGAHTPELNRRRSFSRKADDNIPAFVTQAGELFSAAVHGRRPPPTGETVADQMDLLREQAKMLAGEVAFCTSSLKRMSEQALLNPEDTNLQAQMEKIKEEIQQKRKHIEILERRIVEAGQAALNNASPLEMSETISKLMGQLNEKEFDLEIKTADNRILQEQLQNKIFEIKQLQDAIATLQQQSQIYKEPTPDPALQNQLLKQAAEIERLKQENDSLIEENGGLQVQGQKLAEEANYAKELASAAAVELKTLAEEVKKLSLQNTQLANDLVAVQEASFSRMSKIPTANGGFGTRVNINLTNGNMDGDNDIDAWELDPEDMKRELHARKEREAGLEAALSEKEQIETDLRKKLEEAKQRESVLENDLAGMWVVIAKLKKERGALGEPLEMDIDNAHLKDIINNGISKDCNGFHDEGTDKPWKTQRQEVNKKHTATEELQKSLEEERLMNKELRCLVSKLKGEELDGLSFSNLEEIQNLHMEALTKLCQAKARTKDFDKDRDHTSLDKHREDNISHICKVCFEAPTAAVLLPCRHFCLCKPCAVACTECPLCRSGIADRIITFTS